METKDFIHDHEHPMILDDKLKNIRGKKLCYACNNLVSKSEPVYFCPECGITIDTGCAKLPLHITDPAHSEHPLLLTNKFEKPRFCNSCRNSLQDCFIYTCLPCKFDVCVACAVNASNERTIKHESHPHRLMLLPREAVFYCDACGLKKSGRSSYACNTCTFWIHNDCAFLPKQCRSEHHNHSLSLAYNVPMEFRHYQPYCYICCKTLDPLMWVYFCGRCRFFVHLKCMEGYTPTRPDKDKYKSLVPEDMHDVIQFPWTDMSEEVIKHFIEKKSQTEIQPQEEIKHFSHDHPLILSGLLIDNENDKDEPLCAACIEPISSAPYYTCPHEYCRYLLHKSCAYLSTELQHTFHPGHPLSLRKLNLQEQAYFYCKSCHTSSNGFFFECEACQFQLDLNCAILPNFIKHEAHNQHLLVQKVMSREKPPIRPCNACGKKMCGLGYCCGYCIGFHLHYQCAILPKTIRHRWDKHQLILMYPPFGDHPEEMYCEICEEEIHPQQHWMYHCRDCDQSFHPFCIPRIRKNRHMRFGETVKVDDHLHTLTSVREGKFKSNCARCGGSLSGSKAFECGPCKFSLCYKCTCSNIPSKPLEGGLLPGQEEQVDYAPIQSECIVL